MRLKKGISLVFAFVLMMTCFGALSGCKKEEHYDISYTNWNIGTEAENKLERRMIKAWEQKTGKTVKIIDIGNSGYEDNLTAAAGRGNFADVVMMPNLPMGISNDWLLDIKDLAENDPEWDNIPAGIEAAVHYGDKIYGVPAGMHLMGYFINEEIFDETNVNIFDNIINGTNYSYSMDDFKNAVKRSYNIMGKSVVALSNESSIFEWYPSITQDDWGYFTFDGTKYNLDSPEFIAGITLAAEVRAGSYSFDSLGVEERANFSDAAYSNVWDAGEIAIRWGATYECTDMAKKGAFDQMFIGLPEGKVGIIGDFLGISAAAANKELAYDFAKWMTFGVEGIQKRLELDTGAVLEFNSLPLSTDEEILDAYFEREGMYKGLKEAFLQSNIAGKGVMEGTKFVPRYIASRYNIRTGIATKDASGADIANASMGQLLDAAVLGVLNYSDYATAVNAKANEQYQLGLAALNLN